MTARAVSAGAMSARARVVAAVLVALVALAVIGGARPSKPVQVVEFVSASVIEVKR